MLRLWLYISVQLSVMYMHPAAHAKQVVLFAQAAMASGHGNGVANSDPPQPRAAAPQLGLQTPQAQSQIISTVSTGPADTATDRQTMAEKLHLLETHKDWADKKIDQLIKRVKDAERPQKDEAYRLRDEVSQPLLKLTANACPQL